MSAINLSLIIRVLIMIIKMSPKRWFTYSFSECSLWATGPQKHFGQPLNVTCNTCIIFLLSVVHFITHFQQLTFNALLGYLVSKFSGQMFCLCVPFPVRPSIICWLPYLAFSNPNFRFRGVRHKGCMISALFPWSWVDILRGSFWYICVYAYMLYHDLL